MSLINQMLRDLQQQKKSAPPQKPASLLQRVLLKVPALPKPLVLGGAALALLCFVWWLAGVLSGLLFDFEPTAKPASVQQTVENGQSPVAEKQMALVVQEEPLSEAEREANSPSASFAMAQVAEDRMLPATPASPEMERGVVSSPVVKPTTVEKKAVTAKKLVTPASKNKPSSVPQRVMTTSLPKPEPPNVVAHAPKRLHPDDLPGAVQSLTEPTTVDRPSASQASTPYGMAEESYLDGQWALEKGYNRLAVKSLQRALELYPGHLPARSLLVETLEREGKSGESMFLLAEGLQIAPDHTDFKKRYARLLLSQGDIETAVSIMLKGGFPSVVEDPEAHVLVASLYQKLGESFLAAQTYRNLLVAWPETGAFWVGLGISLESQSLTDEAVACYQKALQTKNLRDDLNRYAEKRLDLLN